jgi:hypothetical protein
MSIKFSSRYYTEVAVKESGMGRAYSTHAEKMNEHRIFVGKPEGRTPLGRPRRNWEDDVKVHLRDIG